MARIIRMTDLSTRLVANGDFENFTAGAPDGWTSYNSPTLSQEQNIDVVRSGASSLKVVSASGARGVSQTISFADGIGADLYHYVRVAVRVTSGVAQLEIGEFGVYNTAVADGGSGDWEWLIDRFYTSTAGLDIRLTTTGTAYFDIVQVGTGYIEFIDAAIDNSFRLREWQRQVLDDKAGGVYRESAIGDGRALIDGYWGTAIDVITFNMRGSTNQDTSIAKLRELMQLVQKAKEYNKTAHATDPVYIETKADDESELLCAHVINARILQLPDLYSIEFKQLALIDIDLTLEHGHWLSLPPNHAKAVLVRAFDTYDSNTYGESAGLVSDGIYVANKRTDANITNVHIGTGGSNLIGSSWPVNILGSTGSTYFGIDTSVGDSGPFCSLVFDIGTAGAGTYTWVLEYWDGSAWVSLSIRDNTADFTELGINSIHWQQPDDWAAASPGGALPAGYYVRVRITSGSFSTQPQQQNINPYSVTWPFAEVQAEKVVAGDIAHLLKLTLRPRAQTLTSNGIDTNRIVIGLRSLWRGADFTAYINFANEQNPSTVTYNTGSGVTAPAVIDAPTAKAIRWTPGTSLPVGHGERWYLSFDQTLAANYAGRFRMFVRMRQVGGSAGDVVEQVKVQTLYPGGSAGITLHTTANVSMTLADAVEVLDMGEITIPDGKLYGLRFTFNTAKPESGSITYVEYFDLILIPVDEWACELGDIKPFGIFRSASPERTMYVEIDASQIKQQLQVKSYLADNDAYFANVPMRANGVPILQRKQLQRLWFLMHSDGDANIANVISVQAQTVARYMALRGDN